MIGISTVSVNEHRGAPRVWLQGEAPRRSGFEPGQRFTVTVKDGVVVLRLDETGDRRVSMKRRGDRQIPIIDVNSRELTPLLGMQVARVVFGDGCVQIAPLASEKRRHERLSRVRRKLARGDALATASVCAGGGVLTHAAHAGLGAAGVRSKVAVFNEMRDDLTDHAQLANDALDSRTAVAAMPLQELAFDEDAARRLGHVDVMDIGLPCSGASRAGRAKRGLRNAEDHPDVGHLVVGALALLARLNPLVAVFENVPTYATSASASIIRSQLRDLGYVCHERELFGPDFGALESRRRWCLVAVTDGVPFDLEALLPGSYESQLLRSVLEPANAVESRWSQMRGLKAKRERDAARGANFKMQVFSGSESHIGTLTKGLIKNRSTDPKIAHPSDPDLLRIPTAVEHARCKQVPERLIAGLSETTAHEMLGQSCVYEPFRRVFQHIGEALRTWAEGMGQLDIAPRPAGWRVAA